jgi:predicted RNA-binding Zn ribbon-like protein
MKTGTSAPEIRPARLGGVEFAYIGGDPVVDFHNTISWPPRRVSNERLRRPVDLVRWAAEREVVSEHEARKLRAYTARKVARSRAELAVAVRLRRVLHDMFLDHIEGRQTADEQLRNLNQHLKKVRAAQTIEWNEEELRWSLPSGKSTMVIIDRLLLSAADLLTSRDLSRLRRCANPNCGWLFLDTTRNGLRKWCSMTECGGRAKAKRYYESRKKRKGRRPSSR